MRPNLAKNVEARIIRSTSALFGPIIRWWKLFSNTKFLQKSNVIHSPETFKGFAIGTWYQLKIGLSRYLAFAGDVSDGKFFTVSLFMGTTVLFFESKSIAENFNNFFSSRSLLASLKFLQFIYENSLNQNTSVHLHCLMHIITSLAAISFPFFLELDIATR